MIPLRLTPACKDYLWGGTKLITEYGKQTDKDKMAESWELSCHPDGESRVAGGPYDGLTLPEALERMGTGALGERGAAFSQFPLLIKLIDARDRLSIQVHPDDAYALRVEGEYGKTEMWYVVDCEEGAGLYLGFSHPVGREEFAQRIEESTLEQVLRRVPVKPGDSFFIPAGTLHAIGAGILIAEIQQNSNTTYRVYDYGRLGTDGKPRPLHVEKALEVTDTCPANTPAPGTPKVCPGGSVTELASCRYFTAEAVALSGRLEDTCDGGSFRHLLVLSGQAKLCWAGGEETLRKGDSLFLPAGLGPYALEGEAKLLRSRV